MDDQRLSPRDPHRSAGSPLAGEILVLAVALLATCLAAKIVLLPFPVATTGQFVRWVLRLAIVVAPDVCFVVALAAACLTLERWCRRRAAARTLLRIGAHGVFAAAGMFAIVSVLIYTKTRVPLRLPALWLSGGTAMSSSFTACLSPAMIAAMLLGPLGIAVAPRLALSSLGRMPRHPTWRVVLIAFVAVTAYGMVCRTYVRSQWIDPNRWERLLAQNPHSVFVASCLREWFRGDLAEVFAAGDDSDFVHRTRGARIVNLPPESRPKNVVLIVMESTGVEYLGLYRRGTSRVETTPHLARLAAKDGIVFENHYVQTPNSCKSLTALTSSVYPRTDRWLIARDHPDFAVPAISEVLAERGYRTCYAHAGYWSWKGRQAYLRRRGQTLIDADNLPGESVNSWGKSDEAMFAAALDWIDAGDRPFFLLAYTIETHHPYVARQSRDFGVADPDLNRYLNALQAADATIAGFLEALRRRGLAESTVVAITADHGESFGQHNQRIHSYSVYEQSVHIPLVLLHPSLAGYPRRMRSVCEQIDIAPTLLAMLGIAPPDAWQGRCLLEDPKASSLSPSTATSPSTAPTEFGDRRAYFFATGNAIVLGLRDGPWKYHYYLDSGYEELFDVADDPDEAANLAADHPARCAAYKRRVGGFVRYQQRFLADHGGG